MEEKNKVYIFDKKEIFLVLIFMVILSITCFTLGIKLGKSLSLSKAEITSADVEKVEMKSDLEEEVEKTLAEDDNISDEEKLQKLMDESKEKLSQELEQVFSEPVPTSSTSSESVSTQTDAIGKYTIQLGSYASMNEAQDFAEGFTVRGYSPIINEVIITGKGKWYRVSLGMFKTVEEAKVFIKKEDSLFQGQDYIITEIK